MLARIRSVALTAAIVPLVGTTALVAAPAGAAEATNPMTNGSFEAGRAGWGIATKRTRAEVVTKGAHRGTKALRLTNKRVGAATVTTRKNIARTNAAGTRYRVWVWVRSDQPGVRGSLVLRERKGGSVVKTSRKAFKADRKWRKVALRTTTKAARSQLVARVGVNRLRAGRSLTLDTFTVRTRAPMKTAQLVASGPSAGQVTMNLTEGFGSLKVAGSPTDRLMSNGCTITQRGLPVNACAGFMGAAYGSNTDPSSWEASMGRSLGVRRTFYSSRQVNSAVATARSDLSKRRLPWMSFKTPYSWTDMANGRGDAWVRDLATKLKGVNGPVWLAIHHEPEGDGNIKEWTRMQARLAPIVRATAPNVAYSIILTGWNQLYGPSQYSLDSLWPNTTIDIAGFDIYNVYGTVKSGRVRNSHTDMANDYFAKINAWATRRGVAWGIAETGFTNAAAAQQPAWLLRTYSALRTHKGIAFSYFNTTLNSSASWVLASDSKRALYTRALRDTPTL